MSIRHLAHAALLMFALLLSGCVVGGSAGNLQSADLATQTGNTGNVELDRQSMVLGTVFDFRALRLVSAINMETLSPSASNSNDPEGDSPSYSERRMFRLDVPALSLWDFDQGGLDYPGMMPHRHTLDVWGRMGATRGNGSYDPFYGGALTYYNTGASVAVSLTADFITLPTEVRMFEESVGALETFQGEADGWVVGFEVTLFAGEHALDIFADLFEIDKKLRGRQERHQPVTSGWKGGKPDADGHEP